MKKLKAVRIIVQIAAFLFAAISLFILSFPFKFIETEEFFQSSPSLFSLSMISAQYIVTDIIILAVFVILAMLFGRVFCGWVCPYGAVMDFFAFLAKPFRKWRENAPSKKLMSKYYLLIVFFALAVAGFQIVWIFEPITVFSRFIHLSLFPFLNTITDQFFQYMIVNRNFGEGIYDFLRNNIFDSRSITFKYQFVFFMLFIIPVVAALFQRRFWCRYICPLGASLGILSAKPAFPLRKEACVVNCGKCEQMCRSNAIKHDGSYIPSECVMCMECAALECYKQRQLRMTNYELRIDGKDKKRQITINKSQLTIDSEKDKGKGMSRRQFLFWGSGAVAAAYMLGRKVYGANRVQKRPVIRPPGSMTEKEFKAACVRCGNCMKVCITNGLQPVTMESGLDGIWTPKMDNITGYCEYSCNACGQVCPTQAIKSLPLEEKEQIKIGNAVIIKEKCVPWKDGIECLVCEEHCPVPDKAIKFVKEIINGVEVDVPVVDYHLCIGCGVCENKCPVEGKDRGIVVEPV